jgi:putative membrane-bound dehydrogenase-like protein
MRGTLSIIIGLVAGVLSLMLLPAAAMCELPTESSAAPEATGPKTEQRFPPLVVPEGFKSTLFACDPLVEYPSVIALGPRAGTLYVAYDYMTGLGIEIVRRDEVRLIADTDHDGYADTSTLYADGFNSIQGLAAHAGDVYVMHAPLLTKLQDTNGDGIVDSRRDLLSGLGRPPEETGDRLHCANGVVIGYDGWLYLALGDRGCDVTRPEGDRFRLEGGGVLRCRADGTRLHVFSRGLRNIFDLAVDDHLNVFTRDNENDGGDYMIRVCHCFHGSDHGYPYLYRERPEESLSPLADLGRGSSAGGVIYLENTFPSEYRGNLFFCEWGRAVVRYGLAPEGSGFRAGQETDFAAGAANDPYGFKPTDLVVDRDGSLLVSDWGDGQRPKRGRARIYRIQYVGATASGHDPAETDLAKQESAALVELLDAVSPNRRMAAHTELLARGASGRQALMEALDADRLAVVGQRHAIWILADLDEIAGSTAPKQGKIDRLLRIAESTADIGVRIQAIRAVVDLIDPVLNPTGETTPEDLKEIAGRLTELPGLDDRCLLREIVIALRRLLWPQSVAWLAAHINSSEPALDHAAMQLLRESGDWAAVARLWDPPDKESAGAAHLRTLALRAAAEQFDPLLIDELIARLRSDSNAHHRGEYAGLLCRACRLRAPWTYWGFRPAPRPANSVDWERTAEIEAAVNASLRDPDLVVRAGILQSMLRENISVQSTQLGLWVPQESDHGSVALLLNALDRQLPTDARPMLAQIITTARHTDENRLRALQAFLAQIEEGGLDQLANLAGQVEDGPVLAALFDQLGHQPAVDVDALLLARLDSPQAIVRVAAVTALVERNNEAVHERLPALLEDPDTAVIRAAATAAARTRLSVAANRLLELAQHGDASVCSAALGALTAIDDPRGTKAAVSALRAKPSALRALEYLARFAGPDQLASVMQVAAGDPDVPILSAAIHTLSTWQNNQPLNSLVWAELETSVANIHGRSGVPARWRIMGPLSAEGAERMTESMRRQAAPEMEMQAVFAEGLSGRVSLPPVSGADGVQHTVAVSGVFVAEPREIELSIAGGSGLKLWLNEMAVLDRPPPASGARSVDRKKAQLKAGMNHLIVEVWGADKLEWEIWFRTVGSQAEHERLTLLVLDGRGDAERGRELIRNLEQSLCLKCHRLNGEGGQIGPDLTGVGSRFSRIHLIESILTPSRAIAPSYEPVAVLLADGQIVTGVRVSESPTLLSIGDTKGVIHEIQRDQIEELRTQQQSIMPDGLEQRFSAQQLVDLVTFLEAQRKPPQ